MGGGITGLVAAYRLTASAGEGSPVAVTLVEASPRVGGKLRTGEVAGLKVETGPDSFVVRKPWAVDLCTELGLGHDLIVPGASGAFVWARGRPVAFPRGTAFGVPADVETILRWRGLSARGRIVAALEPLRGDRSTPPDSGEDEALRDLLDRRLGREAADVLAGPVLAGIHAGDPARMSAAATFPELRAWEAGHGSLIRGARASIKAGRKHRSGPRPFFTTIDGGLDRVVDAIAAELRSTSVFTGTHADRIGRAVEAAYVVKAGDRRILADAIVVAIPAAAASAALTAEAPLAASALRELRTVSTATVTLVYPEGTADRLPDATGLIVPGGRAATRGPGPRVVTACTWISRKWPDASFGDRAVVRCFVGRDGEAAALELDNDDLASAVAADVELTTPLGAAPEARLVTRWPAGLPQYDVGHERRVQAAADALHAATPGIFLAGAAYGGIGIADCVRQGDEAAALVRAFLDERAQAGSNGRSEEATTRS
jgi:oxygen-dependent protoporphyrinogen oxidase